jgi:hypothetical protein
MKVVVGVEEEDDLAAAGCDTGIECRSLAPVSLLQHGDETRTVAADDVPRLVARRVIDDDDLRSRIRLGERTRDALLQEARS